MHWSIMPIKASHKILDLRTIKEGEDLTRNNKNSRQDVQVPINVMKRNLMKLDSISTTFSFKSALMLPNSIT